MACKRSADTILEHADAKRQKTAPVKEVEMTTLTHEEQCKAMLSVLDAAKEGADPVSEISKMLQAGFSPNLPSGEQYKLAVSPLTMAAKKGFSKSVNNLLSKGADVSHNGQSVLCQAIDNARDKVVLVLLHNGAKANQRNPIWGRQTPLMRAMSHIATHGDSPARIAIVKHLVGATQEESKPSKRAKTSIANQARPSFARLKVGENDRMSYLTAFQLLTMDTRIKAAVRNELAAVMKEVYLPKPQAVWRRWDALPASVPTINLTVTHIGTALMTKCGFPTVCGTLDRALPTGTVYIALTDKSADLCGQAFIVCTHPGDGTKAEIQCLMRTGDSMFECNPIRLDDWPSMTFEITQMIKIRETIKVSSAHVLCSTIAEDITLSGPRVQAMEIQKAKAAGNV